MNCISQWRENCSRIYTHTSKQAKRACRQPCCALAAAAAAKCFCQIKAKNESIPRTHTQGESFAHIQRKREKKSLYGHFTGDECESGRKVEQQNREKGE